MENEKVDNKKSLLPMVLVVFLIIIAGGYFFYYGKSADTKTVDAVVGVATVNGVNISKSLYDTQLNSAISLYKTRGVDVENADNLSRIKKEVLDSLIDNELISQGVIITGIKTSSEEIEKQFQLILTQAGGADSLKAELLKNSLTETQLRENIASQLAAQTYLLKNVDIKSVTVSSDEIAQFYDNYSKTLKDGGKEIPTLKDISADIEKQLVSNKQQALVMEFINSLRAKAKIEVTATL